MDDILNNACPLKPLLEENLKKGKRIFSILAENFAKLEFSLKNNDQQDLLRSVFEKIGQRWGAAEKESKAARRSLTSPATISESRSKELSEMFIR
jgi:hypothetical protein